MMNTENTYTNVEKQTGGTLRLTHNYPQKPSWKCSGVGRALIEVTGNPKWDRLDLRCAEVPEHSRGTKCVYVGLPIEALVGLLTALGYTVTKTPSTPEANAAVPA